MADNVIKEFLVSLGFKVDDKSQKKFEEGIDLATAKAVALGEAMYDVAKSVAESVVKMAAEFDQLYWRTQRLGSSAIDVKAFSYAMSQLGGSSQGAASALENIAEFVKSSPGATDFLLQWGVLPEHIGDAEKSLQDLEKTFKKLDYWTAKSIAGQIGIDPLTLQAMRRDTGEFEQWYSEMAARIGKLFGVDLDEASGKAKEFATKLREMKAEAELAFDLALYKGLEWLLPRLNELSEIIKEIVSGKRLAGLVRDANELAGSVQFLTQSIDDLKKAFGKLSADSSIGTFLSGVIRGISDVLKSIGYLAEVVVDLKNGDFDKVKKDWNASSIAMWNTMGDVLQAAGQLAPPWMGGPPIELQRYKIPGEESGTGSPSSTGNLPARPGGRGAGSRANRNFNPGNIKDGSFAQRQPGYIGSDGKFAQFDTVAHGLAAMETLLRAYMAKGRDTIAEIISKWAPSTENNVGAYVTHVEQLTGIGRFDQLQMSDLQRVAAAMAQHEGFRGLGVSGAGRSATVNQTNNYSISSNQDPQAIAHEIAANQHDINQRLVANFGLIVQ